MLGDVLLSVNIFKFSNHLLVEWVLPPLAAVAQVAKCEKLAKNRFCLTQTLIILYVKLGNSKMFFVIIAD